MFLLGFFILNPCPSSFSFLPSATFALSCTSQIFVWTATDRQTLFHSVWKTYIPASIHPGFIATGLDRLLSLSSLLPVRMSVCLSDWCIAQFKQVFSHFKSLCTFFVIVLHQCGTTLQAHIESMFKNYSDYDFFLDISSSQLLHTLCLETQGQSDVSGQIGCV